MPAIGERLKYRRISEEIRRAIRDREFQPGDKLPADEQLAGRFETSRLTVIRALRDLQVEGLVQRRAGSGTFVTQQSRPVSHIFGLLIPDLGEGEIFEPICQGMARTGQAARQALLWGAPGSAANTKEAQALELCRYFTGQQVSGVFLAPVELSPNKDEVNQRIVAMLDRAGIPIVLLDRC